MDAEDISRKWYYARGGQKYGPLPAARILEMLGSGELTGETLVWTRGMDGWDALEETELWGADTGEITVAAEDAPQAPAEAEPGGALQWTRRAAWLFDILAKEGGVILLAAGTALIYLDVVPMNRMSMGAATVLVAALDFVLFKTASATLSLQCHMARRQRRLMDEVQLLAHGPGRGAENPAPDED